MRKYLHSGLYQLSSMIYLSKIHSFSFYKMMFWKKSLKDVTHSLFINLIYHCDLYHSIEETIKELAGKTQHEKMHAKLQYLNTVA